jgi:hypothetical protein
MNEDELRRLADNAGTLTGVGRDVLKLELSRRGLHYPLHHSPEPYDSELSNLPCPFTCLEEWDKYERIVIKDRFWIRYGRALALTPFTIVVMLVLRYFSESASKVLDYIIYASLLWAIIVVLHALSMRIRTDFIRCPRCGQRFGLGDYCSSCGLPRAAKTSVGTNLPN